MVVIMVFEGGGDRPPMWKTLLNFCCSFIFLKSNGMVVYRDSQDCTHSLKIRFVVDGGGFYSYYMHQEKNSDKERKIVRKKVSFMLTKRLNTFNVYH
jgi:hypothetical protein